MHTAIADPLVGRLLEGRYRILSQLARGGMSIVYTANDERLDRLVAVKVMSASLSADPAFTDRFIREARAAARLTHSNAVSVYDQGEDVIGSGRLVFLVMELVSGRTLRELLRERGRLTPAEALTIVEQVLSALAAAHRAGLVHRDIKPENILLADDGAVKVADFGLARAIETDGAVTATGVMMGTVAYCSPEQITRGRTDARSDVYSAGIVLFELLTGGAPYVGESAVNVAFQHVHKRVPAPSSRARGIDPRLDELVLRATDNDPAGRPIDAGAFLAEMGDVRADLDLPIVLVPGHSPVKARSRVARPGRPPDADVTDPMNRNAARRTGTHNTLAVPASGPRLRGDEEPPPPVVIPPPKARKQRTVRARRRRRALIALIMLLLLGATAGYTSWWYASGRFAVVPQVGGDSAADATVALKHAGFTLSTTIKTTFSETVAKDRVISTDPSGGVRTLRSHHITLVVSKGKDLVTIPTVAVGSAPAEALALLGAVQLQVNPVNVIQASDTVAAGKVLATDPPGGTSVNRGEQVRLIVSSGPPILSVPEVTGKTQTDATSQLTALGFKVDASKTDYSYTVKTGLVISQSPTGGSSLAKFQTVSLTISKGPAPVVLPQIAQGTPVTTATTQLQGLGLQVKVVQQFGGTLGVVVAMEPGAGKTVPYGSTVTLTIV